MDRVGRSENEDGPSYQKRVNGNHEGMNRDDLEERSVFFKVNESFLPELVMELGSITTFARRANELQ